MPNTTEDQIHLAESALRLAMLASDVAALEQLIAPDLMFTNHLGQLLGKEDDLALHRSGMLKFDAITPSEARVKVDGQFAIISVRMQQAGTYGGAPFAGDFRYTRLWRQSRHGAWQIAAGHFSVVQQ